MNPFQSVLIRVTKGLLFATLATPLIITDFSPFPFVFGKMLFLRAVVALALLLSLILLARQTFRRPQEVWGEVKAFLRSKLFLLIVGFFVISGALSTAVAPSPFKAFFGEVERGEGLLSLLHHTLWLVMAVSLFSRRDWILWLTGLVAVGVVTSFYAWLQYFEVSRFPFALRAMEQPGSFLGNTAYLGAFLILILGVVALLAERTQKMPLRIALAALALGFIVTIFITAIRGALLGLAAGSLLAAILMIFSKTSPSMARRAAVFLLVALLTVSGIFWATRRQPFWSEIPGLNRFARLSLENPSVATRLIGAGVSFDAFKDRPVFGWGLEHYNVAYNTHYNPAYSYYAEEWFDRGHNKIAEVAVIQGTFGLLLYLGLLGLTFFRARSNPWLAGALTAYVVQNLFLFDNVNTYLPLFGIWGWLLHEELGARPTPEEVEKATAPAVSFALRWSGIVLALVLAPVILYTLYAHIWVPVRQARVYSETIGSRRGERILKRSDEFLYPYNFLQPALRAKFADQWYDSKLVRNKEFRPLVLKALQALEEAAEHEKYEPRQFIRLIENYGELAKDEPHFYEQSQRFALKAAELVPRRQGVLYHLAFNLVALNQYQEAIETNRKAVALDPRVYKSHYQLGLVLALASQAQEYRDTPQGAAYHEEAIGELDRAMELARENDYLFLLRNDFENIKIVYTRLKTYRQAAQVLEIAISPFQDGRPRYSRERQWYIDAMTLYRQVRDAEGMIRVAERFKKEFPEVSDDTDVIIDLARKRNWEILDSL